MSVGVKVLHVISGLGVGGAERLLLWAARYHDVERYPMGVISLMSGGELADGIRETGVPVVELGQRRGRMTPSGITSLFREIGRASPGILQGHMFHSNLLTRLARAAQGRSYVLVNTIHNTWFPVHRRIVDGATAWLADGFVTFSPDASRVYTKPGPFGRPVRHIPYGIEITPHPGADKAGLRARLGLPPDRFIWIAVGSLTRQKAFHDLIDAFAGISGGQADPLLLIAGEGDQRLRLEGLISGRGLGESVRLLGVRMDVPDLLAAADAFVLSSHWEGNPLVLLEAMAAALPAAVTRVGMVPTMVKEGSTALIVEPNQPQALAEAMARMMEMGEGARAMGEAGRSRLERYYDFRRMQTEVEKFYDRLTGVSPPGDGE